MPDRVRYRTEQVLIQLDSSRGPAVQTFPQPVGNRLTDRVAGRRPQAVVQLLVELLELVPDFLLRSTGYLAPQALPVQAVTEGDGTTPAPATGLVMELVLALG